MSGRTKKIHTRISFLFRPSCSLYLNFPCLPFVLSRFPVLYRDTSHSFRSICNMSTRNFAEKNKTRADRPKTCVFTADRTCVLFILFPKNSQRKECVLFFFCTCYALEKNGKEWKGKTVIKR